MIIPNKLYSYNESLISFIPKAMAVLSEKMTVIEFVSKMTEITELEIDCLILLLDVMFVLEKIDMNNEGEIIIC